jgi:hypothetical protein
MKNIKKYSKNNFSIARWENNTIDNIIDNILDLIYTIILIELTVLVFLITKEEIDVFDYNQNKIVIDLNNITIDLDKIMNDIEKINMDLDKLEESIDVYKDLSLFDRFMNLFTENYSKAYSLRRDCIASIKPFKFTEVIRSDSSSNCERPPVISSLLLYHLDIAYAKIDSLNDELSISKIKLVNKDNVF